MIEVHIENSFLKVIGLESEDLKALRKLFSYTIDPTGKYSKIPRSISLVSKEGELPTGLLTKVYAWLKTKKIQYTIKDLRKEPVNFVNFKLDLD